MDIALVNQFVMLMVKNEQCRFQFFFIHLPVDEICVLGADSQY